MTSYPSIPVLSLSPFLEPNLIWSPSQISRRLFSSKACCALADLHSASYLARDWEWHADCEQFKLKHLFLISYQSPGISQHSECFYFPHEAFVTAVWVKLQSVVQKISTPVKHDVSLYIDISKRSSHINLSPGIPLPVPPQICWFLVSRASLTQFFPLCPAPSPQLWLASLSHTTDSLG